MLPLPEVFSWSSLLKAKEPQAFNIHYLARGRGILRQEVLPRAPETASQLSREGNN